MASKEIFFSNNESKKIINFLALINKNKGIRHIFLHLSSVLMLLSPNNTHFQLSEIKGNFEVNKNVEI